MCISSVYNNFFYEIPIVERDEFMKNFFILSYSRTICSDMFDGNRISIIILDRAMSRAPYLVRIREHVKIMLSLNHSALIVTFRPLYKSD